MWSRDILSLNLNSVMEISCFWRFIFVSKFPKVRNTFNFAKMQELFILGRDKMKFNQVCINCFKETNGYEICPHCGCVQNDKPKQLNHLYPFVELNNRYIIGRVVNNGGFGVVYKAYDKNLSTIVAIKELFPTQNSMVTRVPGTTNVITYSGEKGEHFENQKKRFLTEAKTMSKLSYCESIVDVYDFFEENNTAYLVMEFLDGITLREYMNMYPEKMSFKDTIDIIEPVMKALIAVHKENIIHCDVSPDNVFITENGKVKLIDFGAAKLSEDEKEKSITVVAKPGYTPPEQYRSKSKIKPYTDVYATGAMIYRMVTNKLPEESVDRLEKDELAKPTSLGADIPLYAEKSIMKAMALDENARFKNMQDFLLALKGKKKADFPEKELKRKKIIRWTSFASVIVIAGIAIAGGLMYKNNAGIVPSSGNHGITIWLTDKDKNDIQSGESENIWNKINKTYFKNFVSKQNSDLNIKINIEYYSEAEYNDKFQKAKIKPDIYRSDLVENNENYSADISNLYDEIDQNNDMTTVYNLMKSKYSSSNEFAIRYDTPVTYCFNNVNCEGNSIFSYKQSGPNALAISPNVYWRLSDKLGFVSKGDSKSAKQLIEYIRENGEKDLAKGNISYYIGSLSENSKVQKLSGKDQMITYSYSQIPGDKYFYSFFPERFSVLKDSSINSQKASMLYLYFISTSDDVQYNLFRNSEVTYLSMVKSVVNSVKENSFNKDNTLYENASDEDMFIVDDTNKINTATDKLKKFGYSNGKINSPDISTIESIISDLK